ncbi:putative splicing factor 3A subunit 1, Ubiquitin-like domain superfamily, SWAP/Surp superfamily [Helianthus annuus]|uniref:Splicing factor 3A subunit 1, Ubiquitin-like domain superfamily, SWAP/Surp superfamily n=2 Tax=Helianthus annuus TaxID=4232 RepID=A0A9K3NWT2_HELAN|nr:probable splicing factor 3A subunit 1 [Helianthus annuus]KAF5815374.1 putative splicing factor 3A subunit 1, Ubiquitin-like domain superfamily, SWAP/Surp superfamily [Helianthus annuus]KAJ0601890.1 putative splicing factor 3A subunit 1, Ubiquitin-like domain superfamily, SWAP/Surp superfamily [Helianthus annuus]KAJ0936726.1 putative splicing factor 3A subunit 1, Ubiquitin-like domain superfamily, SWAP/Surp superfamily [Helianthus annuus]KAJ0944637.1 putative splicing factor 3A subunit 1, Ubi
MPSPSQVENESGGQIKADSSIRIITPPPDIRILVDKATRFVASVKPRLKKFIAMNAGMRKYTFLNAADPYHAYYQHRLSEFRAQNGSNEKRRLTQFTCKNTAVIEWILKRSDSRAESFAVSDTVLVSPITGELVKCSGMYEHIRDPKYKAEKETLFAKIREITLAQDEVISRSILEVAQIRPDSFGTTEEEVCYAVKAEIERTYPQLFSDQPGPKKRRLDNSLLVPEDKFLSQHPGPACIGVWREDKEEMLEISVESLSESVSSMKEKIAGQIEEAPPANKLKLRGDEGFLKDSLSLAYYNVARDVLLFLEW